MAREFFKNKPDTSTPLSASRLNGLLNGEEAMGSIVVDDISSKNIFNINDATWGTYSVFIAVGSGLNTGSFTNSFTKILDVSVGDILSISATCSTKFRFSYTFIDSSNNAISGHYHDSGSTNRTIENLTVPNNAVKLVISQLDATKDSDIKVQVEKSPVATEFKPYIEFKDDVTEYTLTGTPEHSSGTNTISLEKSRKTVIFNSLIWFNSLTANTWMTIGTIPTNLRPKKELTTTGILKDDSGNIKNYGQILVKTNGEVQVKCTTGYSTLTNVSFSLSWFI